MKKLSVFVCAIVIVFGVVGTANALLQFNNGGIHNIDYVINDEVWVDYANPGAQTTVNMLSGGNVSGHILQGFEDSTINVSGGTINWLFFNDRSQGNLSGGTVLGTNMFYDNSRVTISGTELFSITLLNNSELFMSGGRINVSLDGRDNTSLTVTGGIFEHLRLDHNNVTTIYGKDFAVDGTPVGYGEIFSILGGDPGPDPNRILTGTLASGQTLYADFEIGNSAKIVLASFPEHSTLNEMVTDIDPPGVNPAYWTGDDMNNTDQLKNADPRTEGYWLKALLGKDYDDPSVNYIDRILKGTRGLGLDDKSLTDFDPYLFWTYAVVKYDGMWIAYENNGINNLLTTDIFRWGISHITFFGPTSVPEPATMLLLGLGLIGLAGIRRKIKK